MEDKGNQVSRKRNKKRILMSVAIILMFIVSNIIWFYAGNTLALKGLTLNTVSGTVSKDLGSIKDVKKYEMLFTVREALLAKYDGEIDDSVLLESAIKGMTNSLNDPYTVFMNKEEYKSFNEQSNGEFVGIGAQVGIKEEGFVVIAPIEGSPAEAAGIKTGDVILKVDDTDVTALTLDQTIGLIKGEAKTEVKITVKRANKDILDINIVRDVIKVVSVKGEMIDNEIGYIQLTSFDDKVSDALKESIKQLKAQGMKGMILDLRGNPGGYLNEAVSVASQFTKKDSLITYTIDKYENKIESKSEGGEAIGMPLVILINGGSASASEVVTGALRDHEVAITVGTTSFGKGIVQQVVEFNGGETSLKVTTSKYYTPNGENIHKVGITPDYKVELNEELQDKEYSKELDNQYQKALEVLKEKMN